MLRRGLVLVALLLASLAFADTAKRLILKDGSYQKITKYEVKGDRVHYFSAERGQWEDVPSDMVDWPATQNFEKHQADAASAAAAKAAKEKADEAADDVVDEQEARSPEVAPSLRLPQSGGVFVLDQYGASAQLMELTQSTSQTDDHSGAYILKHTINPIASKTATVELPGAHAKVQVHVLRPVIYLNIDTDTDTSSTPDKPVKRIAEIRRPPSDAYRFRFVKLGEKRDLRILETIKTNIADDTTYSQSIVHTVGQLTPGDVWIKIQPKEDLSPGEYAIEEMLADSSINPYVWDFRINPQAPANPAALQAGQTKPPAANDADTAKRMKD